MPATAKATSTRKPPAARQRAGQPPQPPTTRQPAATSITSLGDPGEQTAAEIQLAQLQAQVEALQQQQIATRQIEARQAELRQQAALPPGWAADPDILGVPGLKPLRITTSDEPLPVSRHALFYLNDKAYTVPDEIGMDVATEFIHRAGSSSLGELAATDFMLTSLLGPEAYAELRGNKRIKPSEWAWIISTCTRILLGALELPKA